MNFKRWIIDKVNSWGGYHTEHIPKPKQMLVKTVSGQEYIFGPASNNTKNTYFKMMFDSKKNPTFQIYLYAEPEHITMIGGFVFYRQNLELIEYEYPPTKTGERKK